MQEPPEFYDSMNRFVYTRYNLPHCPGVYIIGRFNGKGNQRDIWYIGQTQDFRSRLAAHFKFDPEKDTILFWPCDDKNKREKLEKELIRKYDPAGNVTKFKTSKHQLLLL